ncbi:hypothetical protein V1512DRAFT_257053 [Lipomyces arxii]|uniref:uncharacterized protein n=1 Tax=Lipomyces arxii TaxID=56418 RepID=UPI0034CE7DA5
MADTARKSDPTIYLGVIVLTNPNKDPDVNYEQVSSVPSSMSFQMNDISANVFYEASKDKGAELSAMLYVPEIADKHSCGYNTLPGNTTHLSDLPLPSLYNTVAIAPLTSSECARVWMDRAHYDGAQDIIFYGPQDYRSTVFDVNRTTSVVPPQDWIGDTSGLTYSIYYVPGTIGVEAVARLAQYSGNMTSAPFGSDLVEYFDFRDYVRVAVEIDNPNSPKMPGLWVFLVIALAVLIAAAVGSSMLVHCLQYRNRTILRRRIENGEIDLEALGIKRLTVPRWILDKLPVRVYTEAEARSADKEWPRSPSTKDKEVSVVGDTAPIDPEDTSSSSATLSKSAVEAVTTKGAGYSQPTCAICLDDFVPNVTKVRELPCLHIYHLDCIDGFLEHQSSLCPMCKQSALPKGYIPSTLRITNATVRREQRMRRNLHSTYGRRRWGFTNSPLRHRIYGEETGVEMREFANMRDQNLVDERLNSEATAVHQVTVPENAATADHASMPDQLEPNRTRARVSIQQQRASATPGAILADDGTVFVVEDSHESSRARKIFHMLFPYFF